VYFRVSDRGFWCTSRRLLLNRGYPLLFACLSPSCCFCCLSAAEAAHETRLSRSRRLARNGGPGALLAASLARRVSRSQASGVRAEAQVRGPVRASEEGPRAQPHAPGPSRHEKAESTACVGEGRGASTSKGAPLVCLGRAGGGRPLVTSPSAHSAALRGTHRGDAPCLPSRVGVCARELCREEVAHRHTRPASG